MLTFRAAKTFVLAFLAAYGAGVLAIEPDRSGTVVEARYLSTQVARSTEHVSSGSE
jgi:hypothetical protein